jgi:hypothetical protein
MTHPVRNDSIPHTDWLEGLYLSALGLYPEAFRAAYAGPMRQAFRDALADPAGVRKDTLRLLFKDLIWSLIKEHFAMVGDTFGRPALIFNALVLAGISTILALAIYAIPQQVLRQGANDPQIQLATDLVAVLERGDTSASLQQEVQAVAGQGNVDVARSLSPFVIVYDDQGRPLASQAQLNGGVPVPPSGVFDFVRQHGEERVSWQPILGSTRGVRIAAVVQRVSGAHPGFVLAGRSLREVEAREHQIAQMARLAWLGMLGLILVGTLVFGWYTRMRAPAASQATA